MQRIVKTVMLAVILLGWARSGAAQSKPARLEEARSVTKDAAERPAAPAAQLLFGALPLSTPSLEARTLIEKSLADYENVMLDESIAEAKKATEIDPQFALAYGPSRRAVMNRPAALSPKPPRSPPTPLRTNNCSSAGWWPRNLPTCFPRSPS